MKKRLKIPVRNNNQINLAVSFKLWFCIGMPNNIGPEIFELEYDAFSTKYKCCPSCYDEFSENYKNKALFICAAIEKDKIIGVRIFEKINCKYYHSWIIVTKYTHRRMGIGSILSNLVATTLRYQGVKYLSSWIHIDLDVVKILGRHAPLLSKMDILCNKEQKLLRQLEEHREKPKSFYGNHRTVCDYYDMVDSSCGAANFYVHSLEGE